MANRLRALLYLCQLASMQEAEFREALWSGLGRAILYARAHDVSKFRETILDACLHCHATDAQTEGTHAPYIKQLIEVSGDSAYYQDRIVQSLRGHGDDWDAVHRFRLASYIAMDGDASAKRAMYDSFCPGPDTAEAIAISFVEMDGMEGFLFAAEKVGALLLARPQEVDAGWLLGHAQEVLDEERVASALREAGRQNEFIDVYRRTEEELRSRFRNDTEWRRLKTLPYGELRATLAERRPVQLWTWGRHADNASLRLAAEDLLQAASPEPLLSYLTIFARAPFPLDPHHILMHAQSDQWRISVAAAKALEEITHPSVRQFAFRAIHERLAQRESSVAMLASNWQPGDHAIVLTWFEQEQDREVRHRMGMDLRNFWEQHPDPASEIKMLLTLYEKGPCSACREIVVSRLIELNALPDALREECSCDCNEETRGLVS